jgi:arginine decarboxylase
MFLTRGVGYHTEKLASLEEALRDAGIARFNLVKVSSIFPPRCKVISRKRGLAKLQSGQIVHCVLSENQTCENRRLIAASIGVAIPADRNAYGYLSEHASYGQTEAQAGDYAEDLAATMLGTILGVQIDPDLAWDEQRELWKISGKIVRSTNVTQSAIGKSNGIWTSTVAVAVFVS